MTDPKHLESGFRTSYLPGEQERIKAARRERERRIESVVGHVVMVIQVLTGLLGAAIGVIAWLNWK